MFARHFILMSSFFYQLPKKIYLTYLAWTVAHISITNTLFKGNLAF